MKRKTNGDYEIYERQATLCKAFANPTRLHLIEMLQKGERWASELQEGLGISKANLSQHLAILRDKGVLNTRKDANRVYYRVADQRTLQLIVLMREVFCGVPVPRKRKED